MTGLSLTSTRCAGWRELYHFYCGAFSPSHCWILPAKCKGKSEAQIARAEKRKSAPFYTNVSSRYGAPMGRASEAPADVMRGTKLHLARVPAEDGDYDPGGAYWGSVDGSWRDNIAPLWCAWNDDQSIVIYFRAAHRLQAKGFIPQARFYR